MSKRIKADACWVKWSGGQLPVPADAVVGFRMSCSHVADADAGMLNWSLKDHPNAIVAYTVLVDSVLDPGWIPWGGGKCPVADKALGVRFKVRRGGIGSVDIDAWGLDWTHSGKDRDIVAYRVKLPTPAQATDGLRFTDNVKPIIMATDNGWIAYLKVENDKLRTNERRLLDRLEALTADKQRLTDELIAVRQAAAEVRRPVGDWLTTPAARELTDADIDAAAEEVVKRMDGGLQGFCRAWGWRQFARELLKRVGAAPPCSAQCDEEMPR